MSIHGNIFNECEKAMRDLPRDRHETRIREAYNNFRALLIAANNQEEQIGRTDPPVAPMTPEAAGYR